MLVQQSNIGALGMLCRYKKVLLEAVAVQRSTLGELGRLCWYSRVLQEHYGRCFWFGLISVLRPVDTF